MKKTIIYFWIIIAIVGCAGCQKNFKTFNAQFVHGANGVAAVDYNMTGQTAISNINYGSQTAYRSIQASVNDIVSIWVSGHGSAQALALDQLPIWEDGKKYTVFFYKTDTAYGCFNLPDSFTKPAAGHSAIRFVHLGSDAPALDILLNGTEVADNKVFYDHDHLNSFTSFSDMAAGTYMLEVRQHGTTNIIYRDPNLILADGITYSLYACGILNAAAAPSFKIGVAVHI